MPGVARAVNSSSPRPGEEESLLPATDTASASSSSSSHLKHARRLPSVSWRILPIAFIGGFGIAGTVPSIIFVYNTLLCENRQRCDEHEKEAFRTTFAAATTLTNVLSIVMLGPVQRIGRWRRQAGLSLWLIARGLSVLLFALAGPGTPHRSHMLIIGPALASRTNLVLAFVAQALEGVSVDNLLHFNLNAAYVDTAADDAQVSSLFGLSLGLFLAGMAVGPAATSLLPDPRAAFYLAASLFAISVVYILSPWLPWPPRRDCHPEVDKSDKKIQLRSGLAALCDPLAFFWHHPTTLLHGLTLLAFTCGQAFFFSSLLIHAVTNFSLDDAHIAGLVTIISVASSLHLLVLVAVLPAILIRLRKYIPSTTFLDPSRPPRLGWDTARACWSTFIFAVASLCLLSARTVPQLYASAILCSLGNAAPAFVKSHLTTRLPKRLQAPALAAVALCEATGSLLSPLVLGAAWAVGRGGSRKFPAFACVTASLVMVANLVFCAAAYFKFPIQEAELDADGDGQ